MKISVLVPIYGVAQYIEACAVSLFEQTYDDLEYVFVDDCSPDASVSILEEVAKRYPQRQTQMRIIRHERNRGLGAARATALAAATGNFVMVVDSDDVVPTNAVSTLYSRQQETGADMVDGAFCLLRPSGTSAPQQPYHGDKEQMLRLMLLQNTVSHQLWGRLVRRSVYTDNDINSIEGINLAEDYAVMPRLLFCASRAYTDEVVYYYRINEQSTFADNLTRRHILSFLKANAAVCRFITEHDAKRQYRHALAIGMLRTFYAAGKTGMRVDEIAEMCDYQPGLFVRLLTRPTLLPVLKWVYLVEKRLYRMTISRSFC